jgi:hypothetical protein
LSNLFHSQTKVGHTPVVMAFKYEKGEGLSTIIVENNFGNIAI